MVFHPCVQLKNLKGIWFLSDVVFIYTSLPPGTSQIFSSGCFNFIGFLSAKYSFHFSNPVCCDWPHGPRTSSTVFTNVFYLKHFEIIWGIFSKFYCKHLKHRCKNAVIYFKIKDWSDNFSILVFNVNLVLCIQLLSISIVSIYLVLLHV